MIRRGLLLAMIMLLPLPTAHADGAMDKLITTADRIRLQQYGETRKEALAQARTAGPSAELGTLEKTLSKPLQDFAGLQMTGAWQCRTTKVGGILPLVVYGWFECRVTDDGSGWRLAKISGSQRTTGRFYDDGARRLTYLGSQYVDGDKPNPYGSGPESDQVGYAFRTGKQEWRIELPAPFYESKLDILEFRR